MAQIIENARATLPPWIVDLLPDAGGATAGDLQTVAVAWLREHSAEAQAVGKETALGFAHVLVGMIIGAMVAVREATQVRLAGPLAAALGDQLQGLARAFRRIVFAQAKISLVNTAVTALYLTVLLPLAGVNLPLNNTMIGFTFFAGLLPVVGNLLSNTVIVVVSLAQSLQVAAGSLAFLIVIHKFEYFLNARIVGGQINAAARELLTAMLLFEAMFGLPGVVAAPVIYAWVKQELADAGMI